MQDTLTAEDLRFTPPELPADLVLDFVAEHWKLTGSPSPLSGERDQNIRLRSENGSQYVVKIASPIEDPLLADYQTRAMQHIAAADADTPIPHVVPSTAGESSQVMDLESGAHIVRILSWVDGVPLGEFPPPSIETAAQIGSLQGRLCKALADFSHPAATHFMPWDVLNGLVESEQMMGFLGPQREISADALERLNTVSLPRMRELPHQVIHNDAHGYNLMCDPENPSQITGMIDFGDLAYRPLVVDLAVSLESLLERVDSPYEIAAAVASNFRAICPVDYEQLELLLDAIIARSIMLVELLEFQARYVVEDDDYLRNEGIPMARTGLDRILALDPDTFLEAVTRNE